MRRLRSIYPRQRSAAASAALPFVLLLLLGAAASAQRLNEGELGTTAGRVYSFQSYAGPQRVVESVRQIAGIGEVLARTLDANGRRGDYFGKYAVIRAIEPGATGLLNADIIVFGPRARIDDIRNVERIVAGYLRAEFGYSAAQAEKLAALVTKYNAAYRGNVKALSAKYTPLVMSNLTAENAGIALSSREWPGRTRLLIPLEPTAGAQAAAAPAGARPGPGGAGTRPVPALGPTPPAPAGGPSRPAPAQGAAPSTAAQAGVPPTQGQGSAPQAQATTQGASAAAGGAAAPGAAAAPPPAGGSAPASAESPAAPAGGSPRGVSAGGGPRIEQMLNRGASGGLGIGWILAIAIALLALLALLVVLIAWIVRAVLRPSWARMMSAAAREGYPLVEMVVTLQNRHIGNRNVHYLRPGSSASVGGGRSTFLVYFVPVPPRMGVLKYDGRGYTFEPVRAELFPELTGPVPDCIGKEIPAQSTRGYRFTIVFRPYVSPLDQINRLMRSVRGGAP